MRMCTLEEGYKLFGTCYPLLLSRDFPITVEMARFFAVVLFALVGCLTQDLSLGRPNTALDLATRFQDADNSGHLSAADVCIELLIQFKG